MPLFNQPKQSIPSNLLKERFGWPPFSILNTISWDWQRRKDEWETVIQSSRVGRDTKRYNATPTNVFSARGVNAKEPESVSEFDPYLCELMYRWFSREGDMILDPFAGGCVRGVVAGILNRDYYGVELSQQQVMSNIEQIKTIQSKYTFEHGGKIIWQCGDSYEVLSQFVEYDKHTKFNMVFTCPPYYNLEKYSNNPNDLSNMPTYKDFLRKYGAILKCSADLLSEDSFFVIVVSEVRADQQDLTHSQYLGLVPDTIKILQDSCGLHYYNEIILENAIGSLPIRAPKSFDKTRKIGRHHQNILVFYKGKIEHIESKFGKVLM